ncbi:papain-like cysteine peptidase [Rhodobacteraceae bacterium LMO-12]|nr:papain-like cysteine peptidase [Rhodobacteraceae bacterium LMO-JJ12]
MDIERFESLGHNCEFGFVMQKKGVKKSSLLRWAISPVGSVIRGLGNDFTGIYELRNLIPSQIDMVQDTASGFHFHTKMVADRVFVDNHARFHPDEKQKNDYLRARLLEQIGDPHTIFIYKGRTETPLDQLKNLAAALRAKGPSNLLYISENADQPVGSVKHITQNLYQARIDFFSHPARASQASYEVWDTILENADALIKAPQSV